MRSGLTALTDLPRNFRTAIGPLFSEPTEKLHEKVLCGLSVGLEVMARKAFQCARLTF